MRGNSLVPPKRELLETLATVPGLYVPSLYDVTYHDDGTIAAVSPKPGAPLQIQAAAVPQLDDVETCTHIHTPNTEFSNAHLIENRARVW